MIDMPQNNNNWGSYLTVLFRILFYFHVFLQNPEAKVQIMKIFL